MIKKNFSKIYSNYKERVFLVLTSVMVVFHYYFLLLPCVYAIFNIHVLFYFLSSKYIEPCLTCV